MTFYYDGQSICGGVIIAATREEVFVKWLDYVYSIEILPRQRLHIWWIYYRVEHTLQYNHYRLSLTGFDLVEVWRQVRQWSHYDEIEGLYGFSMINDLPISHWRKRDVLKKVALLLNLKCDVMSMVARKLLTK